MIKRIICFCCTLMICLGMIQVECAAAEIDPARSCSLTLYYTRNGNAFSDLEIDIYRVAELSSDGEYGLVEPFSGYPIKIHGISSQQEWQDTAQTIKNYVAANQIEAYQSQKTDSEGRVYFAELETGLYMVKGTSAQDNGKAFVFHDFMIYLPACMEGDYDYDVEAKPKSTEHTQHSRYTVVKLWADSGASGQRPEEVCVDILKDGEVWESVTLNAENNWSYSWDVPREDGDWSVMEKDVPDGYKVSITNNGNTFTITNSKSPSKPDRPDKPDKPDEPDEPNKPDKPDPPVVTEIPDGPNPPGEPDPPAIPDEPSPDIPKTGDTAPLLLYVVIMCISGFGLMILGVLALRERRNEKKR